MLAKVKATFINTKHVIHPPDSSLEPCNLGTHHSLFDVLLFRFSKKANGVRLTRRLGFVSILPRAKVPTCYGDTNVKFKSVVIGFKCLLLTETVGKHGHDKLTTAVCEIMKVHTHSVTHWQKLRRSVRLCLN